LVAERLAADLVVLEEPVFLAGVARPVRDADDRAVGAFFAAALVVARVEVVVVLVGVLLAAAVLVDRLAAVLAGPDVVDLAADLGAVVLLVVDFAALFDAELPLADRPLVDVLEAVVFVADEPLAADFVAPAASFGSFLSPATIAFRSAPALNLGTAVFLARLRSPVRGLRTIREGRTTFSKAPKPVMATFSPLTSSREIVSSTDSSACPAVFLLPSKCTARASMS
jgi:hypothetical protein